jgi:subtilisin family serine protease
MMRRTLGFVLIFLFLMTGTAFAAAPNDPGWSQQWHLRTIHADRAWTKSKGSGVIVAVVDTGVDRTHPDLAGRFVAGRNFVDAATGGDDNWDDQQGHGTFMAGLIAADTGNADGVASVAPLAKIMAVRVLNDKGTGDPSVVARGIRYAADHGADVINLSLAQEAIGGSGSGGVNLFSGQEMDQAIRYAAGRGAVVVIAAGNNFSNGGASTPSYSTSASGVIVVGASTRSDRRAAYSNYGNGMDVLAPGGGSSSDPSASSCQANSPVVSTWWNSSTGNAAYGSGCGTSMAVAHVSGIAALLVARGSSNAAAVGRIERTAVDLYTSGWDRYSGYGRVDAAAAVGATSSSSKPKATSKPRASTTRRARPVGAAGTKPAVKGTKIFPPSPSPSPIRALALNSVGIDATRIDPRLYLFAIALILANAVGVGNVLARRTAGR